MFASPVSVPFHRTHLLLAPSRSLTPDHPVRVRGCPSLLERDVFVIVAFALHRGRLNRRTTVRQVCMSLIAAAYCAMASAGTVSAQETINQGAISGRVLDAQGAAVPGVVVIVRQSNTNVTVQAITETDGRFRFPYLKIGPYKIRAQVQGFKDNARTLVLSAGSAFDISITLEVAGIDAAVTVVAEPAARDRAQPGSRGRFRKRKSRACR